MHIDELDLETRCKIYGYTKKVLRKYQKGIVTGKLTADTFADNILSNDSIKDIIDDVILNQQDFKSSYINYIDTLINLQNDNISKSKKRKNKQPVEKPTITQKIQLRNLLSSTGYTLAIPYQYLNALEVENITKFITTGNIDLGNERIYNYVHKHTTH
ncbi:hypothetical protein CHF27_001875 [Romboutsia maritimum]|uniref:Uncharacterized protein n=1 Tax=Romboutsia maritimum TaxID=2020948 RepID=A0A371IWW5_9FIRM|nr:hypothetical protein [Romboutsia maritimum]RDY24972.1 hypothetical protein CHF27_001875 [Romboutsia maritimum]